MRGPSTAILGRGAARLGTLLTIALLAVPIATAAAQTRAAAPLRAGAARVQIAVPAGTPLGGFGNIARRPWLPDILGRYPHAFWLKPSEGVLDPIAARALVLDDGATRVAWAAVDLVAVDDAFVRELGGRLARRGVAPATLIVSASHTHSGPGAFVDSAVMAALSMDRLDRSVRDALLGAVAEAIARAEAARVPARLATAAVTAPPLTVSRLGLGLDSEVVVLKVTTTAGAPVALVWNYAIHGTVLGPRNLRLSSDVMGRASAALEQRFGVPALFVNGAEGDVSPARHGEAALDAVGGALATAVEQGWERARAAAVPVLATARRTVTLATPRLSLHNCTSGWVPRALTVSLRRAFGREATLVAVAAGDAAWVTVPGELQTALGLAVKADGRRLFERVMIAGVSNGYLGYFVTAEDFARPGYVTCASIHGPDAGACVADTAVELLYRLRGRQRPPAATRCNPPAD